MKSSYSQHSTYVKCSQYWHNNYVKRLESEDQGASTYFGSAVDASIMDLLEGKPDWKQKFFDRWKYAVSYGKGTPVFDNPSIGYAYNDFDADILTPTDISYLSAWVTELNLGNIHQDPIEVYRVIAKTKKNPYKRITGDELKYFSRASWLSLNRKGDLLTEAFYKQFFPKIKKVLSTQKQTTIKDDMTGDSIVGVIDMIVELDGYDKPVILDLKTAGQPYSQDQLDVSDQLTLYVAMKGQEHLTDLVGYVVLCKNIPKDVIANCTLCGYTRDGRHQTCNNTVNGARCNGAWAESKVPRPEVQVLIDKKTPLQVNSTLNDMSNTIAAMKSGLVYKNTAHCHSWYGARCPYFNLCHKGDPSGLKAKGQ